jgi:hypothetical protein
MSLRHARITMALALLMLSLAAVSNAAVLWDQSAISFSTSAPAVANGKFTGFGGYTFYSVNDVTVPAGGWTINTITSYWSDWTGVDMNVAAPTGNLIVVSKTGALPSGTPTTTTIPLSWVDTAQSGQGVYVMTAAGLNVVLAAGDYWITVAPITPFDNFNGNNAMWPALNYSGAPVATWYAGSWSDQYGNYDAAMKIEGTSGGATPTANRSWGQLKALYR